jgi:deazaflavin-dependent oxidoreductase (nitroreductase family)
MGLKPPPENTLRRRLWKGLTSSHKFFYRVSGGRLGGKVEGVPILLLDHVGRKSGEQRTTPLMYMPDRDDLVIVASQGGLPKHPAWWLNLRDSPNTTVRVGKEDRKVTAREVSPEEKAKLWPRLVELYPSYADYQERTEREIPVIVLTRAESSA